MFWLTSALAAVSNLHFFDDHHHFITHSSCHYSPLTHFIIRSRASAWRVWYGGGGWVGGWVGGIMTFGTTTGHIVSVDDHHHFITHSSCHYSPLTHFIIRSRTSAWRVWYGGGWVGGWVGGIMTFGTTTAHIVSVDDHHDFITHSSCHYSPLTHFIIRLRTYAWRVWYGGGGWVGVNGDLWEYIYSWQWRRNCGMDLWQSVPDLLHA